LVDTDCPEGMAEEVRKRPGLQFARGLLGSPSVAGQVGPVDVVYLFDVLSAQAKPSWQDVLATYAGLTGCFLISNAMLDCFERTTRLMDLGEKGYYECVPAGYREDARRINLFRILDQVHPAYGCLHRDAPQYWQWGITDRDLIDTMHALGFRLAYLKPMF